LIDLFGLTLDVLTDGGEIEDEFNYFFIYLLGREGNNEGDYQIGCDNDEVEYNKLLEAIIVIESGVAVE
jgi:hypothetical protein